MTLMPDTFNSRVELTVTIDRMFPGTFLFDRDCDHTKPSSTLVETKAGLVATDGCISIADSQKINFSCSPESAVAYPRLANRRMSPHSLTRCVFSLCELDDTSRPEGALPAFRLKISGENR